MKNVKGGNALSKKRIPVILDGDPGHDDAIAWVLAFASDMLDIKAVTSVSGNVNIDQTTKNALEILTLLGVKDVPIARGCTKPLIGPFFDAPSVHGESGLDGPVMPESKLELCGLHGVDLMIKVLEESEEPVTLVPTGPLTNVSLLLITRPDLKDKIERISLMGGGLLHGNWTYAAEFNILVDPEAAKYVFESGIPIIMAGLDVTEKSYITSEDIEKIRAVSNDVAVIVADWIDFFYKFHRDIGYLGAPVHDPVAIVALINPDILETRELYVEVETEGEFCRGATLGDYSSLSGKKPNVTAITNIDREAYVEMIVEATKKYSEVTM
jgi:pyrimidine-specific ribonucleoside hydrolase